VSKTEEPVFSIVRQANEKNIEIRDYAPHLAAEVTVKGERDKAISEGFTILANFIFGNNISRESISMTAPVSQSEVRAGQKINMTAPVLQQEKFTRTADDMRGNKETDWVVQFIMPAQYTQDTLPKPKDERVMIVSVPARRVVAISFSGRSTQENLSKHRQILIDYIAQENLKPISIPAMAFYDPPWTLPFMRHNEMLVTIE
jgi:hypothetical protein